MLRIAGTGNRTCDTRKTQEWLDAFMKLHDSKETLVITGGAVGFDMTLAECCHNHG